jgi:transaldolase
MTVSANPLLQVKGLGQSFWLDSIRRGHILSGDLKRLIDEDGISGETSNPAIFEKAIGGTTDYAEAMRGLIAEGQCALEIYEALAIEDVRMAADAFMPVYEETEGRDGFVSLEVSPHLAYDTAGTVTETLRLFQRVGRPNVMIKIPGTPQGLPAIEACLYEGINVNITLLFSVPTYEAVAWAYVRALEHRAAEGNPIDGTASVASFFVSRIDTLVDALLEAKARTEPASSAAFEGLRGRVAIANAKRAYGRFQKIFADPRFAALEAKGARVQRPLWASTSTKDPRYRDVLYLESLIGPDTVNTLPLETIDAFRDHGRARPSLEEDLDGAEKTLRELAEAGISIDSVTEQLLDEGVRKFAEPFDKLLGNIEAERRLSLGSAEAKPAVASVSPLPAVSGR